MCGVCTGHFQVLRVSKCSLTFLLQNKTNHLKGPRLFVKLETVVTKYSNVDISSRRYRIFYISESREILLPSLTPQFSNSTTFPDPRKRCPLYFSPIILVLLKLWKKIHFWRLKLCRDIQKFLAISGMGRVQLAQLPCYSQNFMNFSRHRNLPDFSNYPGFSILETQFNQTWEKSDPWIYI